MIVDAHNDLLTELEFVDPEPNSFEQRWLGQLRAGGVGLQVCPIFVGRAKVQDGATRQALRQAAMFHRATSVEGVTAVLAAEDLAGLDSTSNLGLMLSIEGADAFGADPVLADAFWHLGVRMVSLTWNDRNAFADGAGEKPHGGLSRLGEELVDRLVSLGMLVDLAHAGHRTYSDVLDRVPFDATVMVSHASCRAQYDTPRNLDDDQLRALAARGGVVGLMAHPLVVDPASPTLDRYVDHIVHAASVMGIEHVGLGADFIRQVSRAGAVGFYGNALLPEGVEMDDIIEGFAGPGDFPALVDTLERRGLTEHELGLVLGGNFLRVFERGLPRRTAVTQ